MKKTLLTWTNRLYMLIFCVTLFYTGTQFERSIVAITLFNEFPFYLFIPVTLYGILLLIGKRLANNPQYPASYCVAAIATLAISGLFWWYMIYIYHVGTSLSERWIDYLGWPGFVFLCALLIAVFYVICAVITRREHKETAELPKTE